MPWRCPACQTVIHHHDDEEHPHVGVTYRCHVCHVELIPDSNTNLLTVVGQGTEKQRSTRKAAD